MIKILIVLLAISTSQAKVDSVSGKITIECEMILAETRYDRKPSVEEFETYLSTIEGHVQILIEDSHPRATELKAQLDAASIIFYSGAPLSTSFKTEVRRLAAEIRKAVNESPAPVHVPPAKRHSIVALMNGEDTIEADRAYEHGGGDIRSVEFSHAVVKDLSYYEIHFLNRVYRSIERGFVRGENMSGIKRLTKTNHKLVELKVHPTSFRLMGCLDNGRIVFMERVKKSSSTFNYPAYIHFCR